MKTRNGFVSNSSSSSFIIFSSNSIETDEDVKKHILKTDKEVLTTYIDYNEKTIVIKTNDACNYVKPDEEQSKLKLKSKIHQYLWDKFDFEYDNMNIEGMNKAFGIVKNKYKYIKEAPVQHLLGYKIDFRDVMYNYNNMVNQSSNTDTWKKYEVLSRWVLRKIVNDLYKLIMTKYPNTFITEISDEDGNIGNYLEHNYKWKVKHLRISNH